MDTERWQRLSPLLDTLLRAGRRRARAQRLRTLRDVDPALADELESLMALEQDSEDFLAEPLVAPLSGAQPAARSVRTGWNACSARAAWARSGWRRAPTACTSAASR